MAGAYCPFCSSDKTLQTAAAHVGITGTSEEVSNWFLSQEACMLTSVIASCCAAEQVYYRHGHLMHHKVVHICFTPKARRTHAS